MYVQIKYSTPPPHTHTHTLFSTVYFYHITGGIFGTAGAGLTGYKMTRRTQGLQEFAFEKCGESSSSQQQQEEFSSQSSSKLSVVIM